jgi:hypothetical protein
LEASALVTLVPAESIQDTHFPPYEGKGGDYYVADYIGGVTSMQRGPQCFRATQPPFYVIAPHFHPIDQFQVFVRGSIKHGKHVLSPAVVHYTDGYTPYGPFEGGAEGFTFFNLRPRADVGAEWMPESRDQLPRRAGRGITVQTRFKLRGAKAGATTTALIEPAEDGLAAYEVVAAPGSVLPSETTGGSGRYHLILAGTVEVGTARLTADSVAYISAGDRIGPRRAGPEGAHLLELQLPTP